MYKKIYIDSLLSAKKREMKRMNTVLRTQDINNNVFKIVIENLELTDDYSVTITSVFKESGVKVDTEAEVRDGIAHFAFDTRLIVDSDTVENHIYVKEGLHSSDVGSFSFYVEKSAIDKDYSAYATEEYIDNKFNEIIARVEELLENKEVD